MNEIFLIVAGLAILTFGAEILVRGASRLALAFGLPSLVIGLTVVAFGTSAPEMAVSIASSLRGQADVAFGNVVGSNVFNILLILGLSAVIAPLTVDAKIVRFDAPLMIAVSFAAWWMGSNGVVGRIEGAFLFCGLISYTAWSIIAGRKATKLDTKTPDTHSVNSDLESLSEPRHVFTMRLILWSVVLVVFGLACLVLGARWFVAGAVEIARYLGVSELLIGLTIVAGGTSLPELATSIVAAVRGERDIAVGNVIGSNIFNILGVLGLSAAVSPVGISVASQAINFDLPVMTAVAVACMPIFLTGKIVSRWEGLTLVALYVAYVSALCMMATGR